MALRTVLIQLNTPNSWWQGYRGENGQLDTILELKDGSPHLVGRLWFGRRQGLDAHRRRNQPRCLGGRGAPQARLSRSD